MNADLVAPQPRKPWLAALLALLDPVLGLTYTGAPKLGFLMWSGLIALSCVAGLSGLMQNLWFPAVLIGLTALYRVGAIGLAYDLANKAGAFHPRWYNRWYVYVLLLAGMLVFVNVLHAKREVWFGFGTYRVPSVSMSPTLDPGDFIVADSRARRLAALRRGDVVTYVRDEGQPLWLSRVVAMTGDEVEYDHEYLAVNGEVVATAAGSAAAGLERTRITLDADEVFLVGDNFANSNDSRYAGTFPRAVISGVVTHIWYSHPASGRRGPVLNDVETEAPAHVEHD